MLRCRITPLAVLVLLSTGCSTFESELFETVSNGQREVIRTNEAVTFDLGRITPFEWDSVLIVIGDESVPITGEEIGTDLGVVADQLDVFKDRYYFRCPDGGLKVLETSSSLWHEPAVEFLPCGGGAKQRS